MKMKRAIVITNTSAFAAMALLLTFANAELPYPLLPYLKFDLAEIPIVTLLFLMGPLPSLVAEAIHWVALSVARGWVLGPLMKFLAVTPMILGYWIGIEVLKRFFRQRKLPTIFTFGSIMGAVARIVATTVLNIIVLLVIAPEFLKFAGAVLKVVGVAATSTQEVLIWTLLLTGVFNALHVFLSAIVALSIVRGAAFKIPWVIENAWIFGHRK